MMDNDQLTEREIEILGLIAEGRSNQEIGERLFISLNTVKWYTKRIYQKLDVTSRTQALKRATELGFLDGPAPTPATIRDSQAQNQPDVSRLPAAVNRFIGRDDDLRRLESLLPRTRILTLTGLGGTGKTRLALEVANRVEDRYRDGVYFVDLSVIDRAELVPVEIADVIKVGDPPDGSLIDQIKQALAPQHALLVLDNIEHVIDFAPVVSELIAAAPRLTILSTSRELLQVYGEQEFNVQPMSLPDLGVDPITMMQNEVVQLFSERAQLADIDFTLRPDNVRLVAEICARLDGLPLAIELCAANLRTLSLKTMHERISERRLELAGPQHMPDRQKTLRDTVTWSYELLDTPSQRLFARMAVCRGGATLEALDAICGEGLGVHMMDGVMNLLNKSLIRRADSFDGDTRFGMLETIREYALERLSESGELEKIQARHAAYYTEYAKYCSIRLHESDQLAWLKRLEAEHDNVRAVLLRAVEGDTKPGLELVDVLGMCWVYRSHMVEGLRWALRLLDKNDENVPPGLRSRALNGAGRLASALGQKELGQKLNTEAIALARQANDPYALAFSLFAYACSCTTGQLDETRYQEIRAYTDESIGLFQQIGLWQGAARTLTAVGEHARSAGRYNEAREALNESNRLCKQTDFIMPMIFNYFNLGLVAIRESKLDEATEHLQASLLMSQELEYETGTAVALQGIAAVMTYMGNVEVAAQIFGAAEAVLNRIGVWLDPVDLPDYERAIEVLRQKLPETRLRELWQAGKAHDMDDLILTALEFYPIQPTRA